MAVVGEAPCQCLISGGHHTTSPALISSTLPSGTGQTGAGYDHKTLSGGVGMPEGTGSRLKGYVGNRIWRGFVGTEQRVMPHIAGKCRVASHTGRRVPTLVITCTSLPVSAAWD